MLNANRLSTNILITVLVVLLVTLLPAIDIKICRRLGLNLWGGPSTNPDAERLLRVRRLILYAILLVYLAGFTYVVFFSRTAGQDYLVHTALFQDLVGSVRIDYGLVDIIRIMFTEGISEALSHIRIVTPAGITQVYMNIMLFVPMGYLLPYVFAWFRARVHYRPVIACFVISFIVENLQLITKRGFYDLDDLVTNTLGGLIGQWLYILIAYVVTHPDWRRERRQYRLWRKNAHKRTLYPFARKVHLSRTVLAATDESRIWDYYVRKLGFRVISQLVPEDSDKTAFLLELGSSQVEIRCSNKAEDLPEQNLVISVTRLKRVRERLEMNGIHPGPMTRDPFTGLACFSWEGPDHVRISVLEDTGDFYPVHEHIDGENR
ncbi:MAG: VanZ family protein [Lachnospiraceae bacterium]|nr:VanZ family protein [Lachnospiraceae bacterium]